MKAVLWLLGRDEGVRAFDHFVAGSGTTVTHDNDSPLGRLALARPNFIEGVKYVQSQLEKQMRAQQDDGDGVQPCELQAAPPEVDMSGHDALGAVIGGTQGEEVHLESLVTDAD